MSSTVRASNKSWTQAVSGPYDAANALVSESVSASITASMPGSKPASMQTLMFSKEQIMSLWSRADYDRLPRIWMTYCYGCVIKLSNMEHKCAAAVKTFPKSEMDGEFNICILCHTCYNAGNIMPPMTAKEFRIQKKKNREAAEIMAKEANHAGAEAAVEAINEYQKMAEDDIRDQFSKIADRQARQSAYYMRTIRESEGKNLRLGRQLMELEERRKLLEEQIRLSKEQLTTLEEDLYIKKIKELNIKKAQFDELKESVLEQSNYISTFMGGLRFKYESEARRLAVRSLPETTTQKLGEELAKKIGDALKTELNAFLEYMKAHIPTDLSRCDTCVSQREETSVVGETCCGICSNTFGSGEHQRKILGCAHSYTCVTCWKEHTTQKPNSHDAARGITRCPQCRAPMNENGESVPEYRRDIY